jgi:hypothetical protein
MSASPQLLAAVEGLCQVFAAYPVPRYTDPCLCCHKEGDEALLHSKPLRAMDRESLRVYVFDAILVWGDEATFKHFLPRLIELFVVQREGRFDDVDPEMLMLFSKFRYGHWHDWPNSEQESVRNFMDVLWKFVLNSASHGEEEFDDLEGWLCAIAQAEDDLTPYLVNWIEEDSLEAILALSGFLLQSAVVLDRNAGRNSFWDKRDQQYQQVKRWVRNEAVADKLERAAQQWAKTPYEEEFLAAWAIVT